MSALNDILTAVVTQTATLNLTAPGATSPMRVLLRKTPRDLETLDPSSQITVSKSDRPEKVKWLAFPSTSQPKGTIRVEYLILVTILTPGNADYVGNIALYTTWREQVRGLFQAPPLTGASTVVDLNIDPQSYLPPAGISKNWDAQVVGINVVSIEAGNA